MLPLVAVLVVFLPIGFVRENLVSFVYLFELGFGFLFGGADVRVAFARQLAECLLDFFFRGIPVDTQRFVVAFLGH